MHGSDTPAAAEWELRHCFAGLTSAAQPTKSFAQLREEAIAAGVPLRDINMAMDEAELKAVIASKLIDSDLE